MTTSATSPSPADRPEITESTDRGGLAPFLAVLSAISRLVHDWKGLPVPWTIQVSCHVADRAALERIHQLYGGQLFDTWLAVDPAVLEAYLSEPADHRGFYVTLSVHIKREDQPL